MEIESPDNFVFLEVIINICLKDYYRICNGFFLVNARIIYICTKFDVYNCIDTISYLRSTT